MRSRVSRRTLDRLRDDLLHEATPDLTRRRGVIALSLVGMASMAVVSLLQTGMVRHLPDPPLRGFDSDRVNASDVAYRFGVPDGTLSLAAFAANVPLAAAGSADRARRRSWLPLLAAGKAAIEAAAAGWYFYQMPAREKAWCAYCIIGALASVGVFVLTVPEARRALRRPA
jgi:uncharacterized membrane protein